MREDECFREKVVNGNDNTAEEGKKGGKPASCLRKTCLQGRIAQVVRAHA